MDPGIALQSVAEGPGVANRYVCPLCGDGAVLRHTRRWGDGGVFARCSSCNYVWDFVKEQKTITGRMETLCSDGRYTYELHLVTKT